MTLEFPEKMTAVCTEDIAKFGQLYLQKGRWNGKQVILQAWIEQATSKQVPNKQESHSKSASIGGKATVSNSGAARIAP